MIKDLSGMIREFQKLKESLKPQFHPPNRQEEAKSMKQKLHIEAGSEKLHKEMEATG